ncbi:hypothetical protein [Rhodococcus sp. IEGM 1318]|nr:hypothetical protein [Rhodococcus sp. IEGM 1318]MDV8009008.1 hypothetical protein [Rhodococcus sp. IEGM 1318]
MFARATCNRSLEAEGRPDQVRGNLEQFGAEDADAFKYQLPI